MAGFFEEIRELHSLGHCGQGQCIGHLDSGVDVRHPSLSNKVIRFRDFKPSGLESHECQPDDTNGHGTQMAGIMVGRNLGIAPAANLISGRVIEAGNVVARLVSGFDWIADQPAGVVYSATGIYPATPVFHSILNWLTEKDVLVIAPIGNLGAGIAHSPACCSSVLAVGAVDNKNHIPSFSGSQNESKSGRCLKPEVVAPGVNIPTTHIDGADTRSTGTSIAAASIAGLACLLRQAFPHASARHIRQAITQSATHPEADQLHRVMYGIVQPMRAFEFLKQNTASRDAQCGTISETTADQTIIHLRLKEKMDYCHIDTPIDAILEFKNKVALHQFMDDKEGHYHKMQNSLYAYHILKNVPIAILRISLASLKIALRHEELKYASAADFDRSPRW